MIILSRNSRPGRPARRRPEAWSSALERPSSSAASSALTVMEMMVSVSLLAIIILGLYAMFDQTHRAFKAGTSQVDIMEGGRAAMDLLTRDLEQLSPSGIPYGTNFYAASIPVTLGERQEVMPDFYRTNILDEFFFLTRFQDKVTGIGYKIARGETNQSSQVLYQNGVGALYRFSTNINYRQLTSNNLVQAFQRAGTNELQRVTDNVIHLRLKVFDTNGWELTYRSNRFQASANVTLRQDFVPGETQFAFLSNALPASVEIELGILDPAAAEHARSIPDPAASRKYLLKQGNKVHLLRQHIPVRNYSK